MTFTLKNWSDWDFHGAGQWMEWLPLTDAELKDVPEGAGAYIIGLKRDHIGRLLADDPHAVVDIGESVRLQGRLRDFRRCAGSAGQQGHMAGWRLGSFGLLGRLGVTVADLRFSYRPAQNKDDAYRIEGEMLRMYFDIFGELPPLNYKFNWATWVGE